MRFLVWVAVLAAAIYLVRLLLRSLSQSGSPSRQTKSPDSASVEKMLPCRQCGIHVPASEAIAGTSELPFCSEEHRKQYLSK